VKLENDFDTDICFQPFPFVPNKAEIPIFFNNATTIFPSFFMQITGAAAHSDEEG
jgi:hypothetical protein